MLTICEVGIASILRNLLWYVGIDSIYSTRYRAVSKAVYNLGTFRHIQANSGVRPEDSGISIMPVRNRGHLAPTVRAWAARRSIQGTQGRNSPT